MRFKRKRVTVDDEKAILINMIISTAFLREINRLVKKEYFTIPYAKYIIDWVTEYYKQYNEAPKQQIQDLYNVYKSNLPTEEASIIAIFLQELSNKYEEKFNEGYQVDKALLYFRKRALEHTTEQIKSLVQLDRIDEAELIMSQYKKVLKDTSQCVNPNDPEFIENTFSKNEDENHLIKFPGVLGELLGWFDRGYLVVVQAPYKMSKTWFLEECRMIAALNRYRSVGFNFEMTEDQLATRYWKRITAHGSEGGIHLYPVFDCLFNQIGDCELAERTGAVPLYKPHLPKPTEFYRAPKDYVPCDYCRHHEHLKDNYKQEFWYLPVEKPPLSVDIIKKKTSSLTRMYGDFSRIKCFPRGSANVDDIKATLDVLEFAEGFVPDVITVDYATIMAAEIDAERGNEESKLDKTLLSLAGLATERHCLVVTASQVKTEVLKKTSTRMGDASQSTRAIYAHPTLVLGIMQTDAEKAIGMKRFNLIAHRFKQANPSIEVAVLQHLDTGQFILDSDWLDKGI